MAHLRIVPPISCQETYDRVDRGEWTVSEWLEWHRKYDYGHAILMPTRFTNKITTKGGKEGDSE